LLDALTPSHFEPLIGSAFVLLDEPERPSLTLIAVEASATQASAPRAVSFSLLFTGPPGMRRAQRISPLEHPVLGRLDLFLVPMAPEADGMPRYEAVFN
jgi:hypothetical protein